MINRHNHNGHNGCPPYTEIFSKRRKIYSVCVESLSMSLHLKQKHPDESWIQIRFVDAAVPRCRTTFGQWWGCKKVAAQSSWNQCFCSYDVCTHYACEADQRPLHWKMSTCPLAGKTGWRSRGETFSWHRNCSLRQLTQEGRQGDTDICLETPKLWTNTFPRDKSQSEPWIKHPKP